jgi:uncharacterized damage-inducible protein DinB
MTLAEQAVAELESARDFFNRSTRNLTEAHSTYAPVAGTMTVAQQVAHAAHTFDWFIEGAFRPEGFDVDFEAHQRLIDGYTSLAAARAWFEKAVEDAKQVMGGKSDAELLAPMPEGPIMGGAPRIAIISALTDHTAHHRGALTVYARLQGIVPPMPYMDV